MKNVIIWVIAFGLHAGMKAQGIESVLENIENNNKELQVIRRSNEALVLEAKTDNNLEELSVEYSPFYKTGVSGTASSELVVTQGFDFPTLYAARKKSRMLQQEALNLQYLIARQNILLTAKNICFDLILAEKERILLETRSRNAEELLGLYEKRLAEGDATIIEINKIKMEQMGIFADVSRNNSARDMSVQALIALNGNEPLSFDDFHYPEPLVEEDYEMIKAKKMSADLMVRAAGAEMEVSRQEVNVSRQTGIPKFEVGYRRNTEQKEASNGFLVGASIPIFSNRHKVKAAKAQFITAQMKQDDVCMQAESRIRSQYENLKALKSAVEVYDVDLMYATLDILKKAVEGGELSLTEYYVEADAIYVKLQEYINLENQYMKAFADFCKNDL